MLTLTRKEQESITITTETGETITVTVTRTGRNTKLAIDAPRNISILRTELIEENAK